MKNNEKNKVNSLKINERKISDRYFFNILPFECLEKEIVFYYSIEKIKGLHRFHKSILPKDICEQTKKYNSNEEEYIYSDFCKREDSLEYKINLKKYPSIARAYYTKKIQNYLFEKTDYNICNFLYDTQFFCLNKSIKKDKINCYDKFTLRVQFDYQTDEAELLVSYDGISRILKSSVNLLTESENFDSCKIKKVAFGNRIYSYDKLPKKAKYHLNEVYPVLNKELGEHLNFDFDYIRIENKLQIFYDKISSFYNIYLKNSDFKKIIAHNDKWKFIEEDNLGRLPNSIENTMVFGEEKTDKDPYYGIKNNGPLELPKGNHFKYFFIYFEDDEKSAKILYEYIIKKKGFLNLKDFTRIPIVYDKKLNVIIKKGEDAYEKVKDFLQTISLEPNVSYYAFYLSPYSKFEKDKSKKEIYYHLKEALLYRSISMQAVEISKLTDNFKYSVSNIGIAMIAKLGGIPWRLDVPDNKDLVIGFGAYRTKQYNRKYVGSAICFSQDGTFQEFDVFPSDSTEAIAGEILNAFLRFTAKNPNANKIFIHFYKQMNQKELEPIEKMMRDLKIDIPIIIASINKTPSKSLLLFDDPKNNIMPLNGSWAKIGYHKYLLYINERKNELNKGKVQHLPLKISMQSNSIIYINNQENTEYVLRQIYEFCFMHWRSVNQPPMPVTVKYPEMIASFIPWFKHDILVKHGRDSLWFL